MEVLLDSSLFHWIGNENKRDYDVIPFGALSADSDVVLAACLAVFISAKHTGVPATCSIVLNVFKANWASGVHCCAFGPISTHHKAKMAAQALF